MYKVTVGICCYKQKQWLSRCLRSLASQSLNKDAFEIILVNDDPEEDLEDVCSVFKEYLNIKIINNKRNLGLPSSLNKILKNALGKYFVRIDCDDYVSSDFLYILSSFLESNSGPRVLDTQRDFQAVSCDYFKVNDCGQIISRHLFSDEPIACGIMFSYETLCSVGFYNEEFKMREGHELLKRYKSKYKIYSLPMPLYKYRMHDRNRTADAGTVAIYDTKLGNL